MKISATEQEIQNQGFVKDLIKTADTLGDNLYFRDNKAYLIGYRYDVDDILPIVEYTIDKASLMNVSYFGYDLWLSVLTYDNVSSMKKICCNTPEQAKFYASALRFWIETIK